MLIEVVTWLQSMMWGEPDLAGTAVDLGNDAEFGIIGYSCRNISK